MRVVIPIENCRYRPPQAGSVPNKLTFELVDIRGNPLVEGAECCTSARNTAAMQHGKLVLKLPDALKISQGGATGSLSLNGLIKYGAGKVAKAHWPIYKFVSTKQLNNGKPIELTAPNVVML